MEVLAGSQENVNAVFFNFIAHGGGKLFHQFRVPCAGKYGSNRETGAVEGLAGAGTGGVDAEAGRAIGKNGVGNAKAGDCAGGAGCAGYQGGVRGCEGTGGH